MCEGTVLSFEGVVGKALVLSEGTGVVRTLLVFDMTAGEQLLNFDSYSDERIVVENDHQFTFYRYDDDLPQVFWNQKKAVWENRNEVPAKLKNANLEEAKKKNKEYLFDGLTLMAHQKVRVDIQTRKATLLDEYQWSYIE